MTPPEAPKNDEIGAAGAEKVKKYGAAGAEKKWKKYPKKPGFFEIFQDWLRITPP